ncbi:MAG: hypothetical protein HY791_08155 [Deltaproteobacteria bacterium]|nr:hypothetical protein [Deltaproteobacteria bacterium]
MSKPNHARWNTQPRPSLRSTTSRLEPIFGGVEAGQDVSICGTIPIHERVEQISFDELAHDDYGDRYMTPSNSERCPPPIPSGAFAQSRGLARSTGSDLRICQMAARWLKELEGLP